LTWRYGQAGVIDGQRKVRGKRIAPTVDQQEDIHRTQPGDHVVACARAVTRYSGHAIVARGDVVENRRAPGSLLAGQSIQSRIDVPQRSPGVLEYHGHHTRQGGSRCGRAAGIEGLALNLKHIGIVNRRRRGNIGNQPLSSRRNSGCGLPTGPRVHGTDPAPRRRA